MAEDRLITVAIHTYDHAVALKALLEGEGIRAVLQNVNLSAPVVSSGVRVRILESDLPKALRIIENRDIFMPPPALDEEGATAAGRPGGSRAILVPVDFSDHSLRAVDFAFGLAERHRCAIVLVNAYLDLDDAQQRPSQLSATLTYDDGGNDNASPTATAAARPSASGRAAEANRAMALCTRRLRERIKSAELPAVKFSTEVIEGLPEEVIVEYAKANNPALIVMGTRESDRKGRELLGSVTAEVLDSCRTPIIAIPASASLSSLADLRHAVLFCDIDQHDILALDALYGLLPDERLDVTLISIPDKKRGVADIKGLAARRRQAASAQPLLDYCRDHYPRFSCRTVALSPGNLVDDFETLGRDRHIDLIAVPNRKKNMFARLFNPSLAHRLIFHADIPLIAIPV